MTPQYRFPSLSHVHSDWQTLISSAAASVVLSLAASGTIGLSGPLSGARIASL
jgi:hypothetical protein